jgi:Thioredoxin-like domain
LPFPLPLCFHDLLLSSSQSKFVNSKYEKQKARYPSKSVKKETLQKFYRSKSLPLVAEKNSASTSRYEHVTLPLVTVYADVDLKKNPKGYQYLSNRISKIAKEYENKAIFVVSDKVSYSHEFEHYGLPTLLGMHCCLELN